MKRQRYQMTETYRDEILAIGRDLPRCPDCGQPLNVDNAQERANEVWQRMGKEMGFAWDTAQPIPGEPSLTVFSAEPLQ